MCLFIYLIFIILLYLPLNFSLFFVQSDPEYADLSKRLKNVLLAESGNIFGTKIYTKKEIHKKADL